MKLFGSYGSPFTRRVGVTLLMYGFKFEHVALRSSVPEELEELKKLNPLARVPALQTDDGMVFVDSTTILDYLDQLKGSDGQLMPTTGLPNKNVECDRYRSRCSRKSGRLLLRRRC